MTQDYEMKLKYDLNRLNFILSIRMTLGKAIITIIISLLIGVISTALLFSAITFSIQPLSEGAYTEYISVNSYWKSGLQLENKDAANLPIINASEYEGENDTERLQAALDDVPEGGAIVFISSGVWKAAGLRAKSNTIILGSNGTVIERPENTTKPFINFTDASNFAVINVTFNGKNIENAMGIIIMDCQNFMIKSNVFINIAKTAVKVIVTLNGTSSYFTIEDNIFLNCQIVPIHLFGIPSRRAITDFLIKNNILKNGTRNGKIGIAFSANGLVAKNKVINCENGIATRCITNITIAENEIVNVTDYGIYLGTQIGDRGTNSVRIKGNEIRNGRIGISRRYGGYPVENVEVINNVFINNREYDIIADFPGLFINNTITNAAKLKITDPSSEFFGTRTISGQLVIPGDINLDYKIDIIDISFLARLFGSTENSPNWNETADIISDGQIDIKDVSFVAKNFGFMA